MTDEHIISIDNNGFFAVDEAGANIVRRFLARAYVFGNGKHWDGCELEHPECALLKLEQLRKEIDELKQELYAKIAMLQALLQDTEMLNSDAAYSRLIMRDYNE